MSLDLFIVRHGQSEGNRDKAFTGHGPSGLTDLGKRQAEAVADRLLTLPVSKVYSSDLRRAMETARPFCEKLGLEAIRSSGLRERDIGAFTGLTFREVAARHPEGWTSLANQDFEYRPPEGESHRDCALRVGGFLDGLIEQKLTGGVALFSHGVAIHHMLTRLLGLRGSPAVMFAVDNASIHRVELRDEGRVRVWNLNDISHLQSSMG